MGFQADPGRGERRPRIDSSGGEEKKRKSGATLDRLSVQGQKQQQTWHWENLTGVLQPSVFTDGSWGLQVGPVMKEHLHRRGLDLGGSVGYDIKKVLRWDCT